MGNMSFLFKEILMADKALIKKEQQLKCFFEKNNKIALAFSGGTDSSYLLYAAKKYGCDVKAYYVKTAFQPQFEFFDAKKTAEELSADLSILEYDIFAVANIISNQSDRCYHCKSALLKAIIDKVKSDGYNLIIDGTNASDDYNDRPGMKALLELGISSPLRELGITKQDVRALSKKTRLPLWDKPAYSCLATRISTGTAITRDILNKIERAEDYLMGLGFSDFRVRYYNGAAKLEVKKEQLNMVIKSKDAIHAKLSESFSGVMLDLKTR
jgi:uncharacterized protein